MKKSTNMNPFFSGTQFACAPSGKSNGCTITDGKQTCYCTGENCNTYTMANFYSSAVAISTPALLIFALVVSGFAFAS